MQRVLKNVFGGYGGYGGSSQGNCTVTCNTGVTIANAPDCSTSTVVWACTNQNGPTSCSCSDW